MASSGEEARLLVAHVSCLLTLSFRDSHGIVSFPMPLARLDCHAECRKPSWQVYAARIILGLGNLTCIVSGSALIGGLTYPKERPVLTSQFNVSYFVGHTAAGGIMFGTNSIASNWGWCIPSLLQMAPSLGQLSFIYLIPESPRWLMVKDRSEEACDILVKYHAEGNRDDDLVRAEMAQMQTTIRLKLEAQKKSWFSVLATPGMRRRGSLSSSLGLFTQVNLPSFWLYQDRF